MIDIITVRLRNGEQGCIYHPGDFQVQEGDSVIVETAQGLDLAVCTRGRECVDETTLVDPLRPIVRMATEQDLETARGLEQREQAAFGICQQKIAAHHLDMKLVRVSCCFDNSRIVFFFTADERVDFRQLVRDLAATFRTRIELRQIGVRDEARYVGGVGICGQPFCCARFLNGFAPVSIKMAKVQGLSLNPTKISGSCGRLMCCLKYEQCAYEDAAKRMPKAESFVQTPDGTGNVRSVNLLQETMKVSLDGAADQPPKTYHSCEVRVLRNGRGSREGIEIPADRPARYVEEHAAEPSTERPPFYTADPQPVPAPDEKRRRTGSASRKGKAGTSKTSSRGTAGSRPDVRNASKRRRPNHRGGHRHGGSGGGKEE